MLCGNVLSFFNRFCFVFPANFARQGFDISVFKF